MAFAQLLGHRYGLPKGRGMGQRLEKTPAGISCRAGTLTLMVLEQALWHLPDAGSRPSDHEIIGMARVVKRIHRYRPAPPPRPAPITTTSSHESSATTRIVGDRDDSHAGLGLQLPSSDPGSPEPGWSHQAPLVGSSPDEQGQFAGQRHGRSSLAGTACRRKVLGISRETLGQARIPSLLHSNSDGERHGAGPCCNPRDGGGRNTSIS